MSQRHLPPLNALRIFETAARANSFSDAAEQLGITHGAVSRQIALLEDWLGQTLFVRQGQRNSATEHARAFAFEISAAFDRMSDAAVRFGKTPRSRVIRVNAQTTFALRWLIPRLPEFQAKHPDIEVAITTSHTGEAMRSGVDVVIRREPIDRPEWRYFEKKRLFEEQLTVVAAPNLAEKLALVHPEDLRRHVFVSSETRVGEWERWLEAAGIGDLRPLRFQRFDHSHVGLQAVIDGLGVGIGGFPTLSRELRQGRLIAPFPIRAPGSAYAILIPHDVDKSYPLQCFLAWIEAEAKRGSGEP